MSDETSETYLGDGLWASHDGYMIQLTANKGSMQEQTVYLEPGVYAELVRYAGRVWPGDAT